MKNTFGRNICLTIYGESHGAAVGAVLDGMPGGVPVEEAFIAQCMDHRRARGDGLSTARTEADEVHILSGVYRGVTTGTPIAMEILNQNTRSGDYAKTADLLRPGHADYTAYAKYNGYQDARGGGHFSGRITVGLVAGGAICLSALEACGVHTATHLLACAGIADKPFTMAADTGEVLVKANAEEVAAIQAIAPGSFLLLKPEQQQPMQDAIRAAGAEGDSVGGVLETAAVGLPAGLGDPFFDSVESRLAHMLYSIPAVKAVEFGEGFGFAQLRGSTANDPMRAEGGRVVTVTNRNGGVNGGITNGMPVVFRTCIKPTPSIYKAQQTVNYTDMVNAELQIKGRHDPCIAPRAAIVQTCASALVLADLLAARYGEQWPGFQNR